ncbi:hypothetical protein EDC04DRAFT_1167008 [Pisolithus marmoratus]|nr:hypothetical protein EDC04DRAFT_1167008 [Pisolithus marmoratus]
MRAHILTTIYSCSIVLLMASTERRDSLRKVNRGSLSQQESICARADTWQRGSSPWWPPRMTRRNIGIPRVEEIFVDVRPRRDFRCTLDDVTCNGVPIISCHSCRQRLGVLAVHII